MKFTINFLVLMFVLLSANAESPCEQLKQMVEQLQSDLNDNALREKNHQAGAGNENRTSGTGTHNCKL